MSRRRKIRRLVGIRRDEGGFALIAVLVILTVITVILVAVSQDNIQNMSLSQHAEDWNAVLGAADSGASDFLYRLNSNESQSYCVAVRSQPGTTVPGYCSSVSTPPAVSPNWSPVPDNSGVRISCYSYSVPTNGLPSSSALAAAGIQAETAVVLDVTGKLTTGSCSNPAIVTRKITVTFDRTTYLNYAYFTDRETQDPAQYNPSLSSEFVSATVPNPQGYADQYCSNYYYALSPGNTVGQTPAGGIAATALSDIRLNHSTTGSYTTYTNNNICTYTKWTGDTFNGPVHTNDVFFMAQPTTFDGLVTVSNDGYVNSQSSLYNSTYASSSNPTCGTGIPTASSANEYDEGGLWVDTGLAVTGTASDTTQTFPQGIECVPPIPLPTLNSTLAQQAQTGGCIYQGLTYLYFNSSGTIDIYSPSTPSGTAGLSGACPVAGVFTPSSNPAFNGVIYVQNLANSASCTLSTAAHDTATGTVANLGAIIQDNDMAQLEIEDLGQTAPYGAKGVNPNAFDCHNGDAFVGGNVDGQFTVGADDNIVVYQNLEYADDTGNTVNANSSNVLGLEPKGSVKIYNPVSCPNWTTSNVASGSDGNASTSKYPFTACYGATSVPGGETDMLPTTSPCPIMTACQTLYIQAAILCFNGEFTAENWSYGPHIGTITVTGSVTQRYRGRLAGTSNDAGYAKSYGYDSRLAYVTPPDFFPPGIFSWNEASFSDTTADTSN
jgi:Tfp pilus assembly protein PilX